MKMLSAQLREDGVSYTFKLDNGKAGTNTPKGARWESFEEMRVRDKISLDPYIAPSSMQEWEWEMGASDKLLSRVLEDILDGMPDKSGVAQITLDRLQAKKDLRAKMP